MLLKFTLHISLNFQRRYFPHEINFRYSSKVFERSQKANKTNQYQDYRELYRQKRIGSRMGPWLKQSLPIDSFRFFPIERWSQIKKRVCLGFIEYICRNNRPGLKSSSNSRAFKPDSSDYFWRGKLGCCTIIFLVHLKQFQFLFGSNFICDNSRRLSKLYSLHQLYNPLVKNCWFVQKLLDAWYI